MPQGCSKVGPGHSKPETRRPQAERNPKAELIATPAEQPPIESGHSRNSDFGLLSDFGLRSLNFRAAEQDLPSTGRTLEPPCLPAKSARRIAPLIFARTNSGRQCPYSVRLSVAGRRQGGLRQWFLMARAACDGARVSELARGQWRQHAGSEIGVPGRDHGAGSRAAQVELASPVPAGQH